MKNTSPRIALICSSWHEDLMKQLRENTLDRLNALQIKHVEMHFAPGCLEIPLLASKVAQRKDAPDALIALGILFRGNTDHYKFVLRSCSYGLMRVMLDTGKPITSAILAGDKSSIVNRAETRFTRVKRGAEAADAAFQMLKSIAKAEEKDGGS
jgi:6,7-dimethyl-8-ribityllumazine synthase